METNDVRLNTNDMEVQKCELILFNQIELAHEIPHYSSIFRNSRFKLSHCPVQKII